jgi:hypothetical protein
MYNALLLPYASVDRAFLLKFLILPAVQGGSQMLVSWSYLSLIHNGCITMQMEDKSSYSRKILLIAISVYFFLFQS